MAFVAHTLALSLVPFCSCWSLFSFSFVETVAFHSSFERVSLAYCSFASFAVAVVETVVVVTLAAFSFALSFAFSFTFTLPLPLYPLYIAPMSIGAGPWLLLAVVLVSACILMNAAVDR